MSGLKKQKKYNWKETNLAYFGSDLEKKVKTELYVGELVFILACASNVCTEDLCHV